MAPSLGATNNLHRFGRQQIVTVFGRWGRATNARLGEQS
jgi:hypothetical protein